MQEGDDGMTLRIGTPCIALPLLVLFFAMPAMAADGNAEDGGKLFRSRCHGCHEVGPDAKNKSGPLLNGLIGRKAGTIQGFGNYSPANHKAGVDGWVWTEANLDEYLQDPKAAMPGNRMTFAGLRDAQDRADLIAYLKTFPK
jgi:cytochrome c